MPNARPHSPFPPSGGWAAERTQQIALHASLKERAEAITVPWIVPGAVPQAPGRTRARGLAAGQRDCYSAAILRGAVARLRMWHAADIIRRADVDGDVTAEMEGQEAGERTERPGAPPPDGSDHALAIDARGLSKSFDAHVVLRDLDLRVRAGEIFGLIGPSGSGKSTAIHLMCGHLRPTGGEVKVLGESPTAFSARTRRRIGYMPQGFILYPDLTVKQNVGAAAGLYELPEWRNRGRIRAVLDLVELWDARGQAARSLSGGMRRRLALAAAIVHDPDLLFADEPTANLDPILRSKLWNHFREMSAAGKTLLVTTQYIDEVESCDRVGLTYDGKMIAEGRPEELRRDAFGGDVVEVDLERPSQQDIDTVRQLPWVRSVSTAMMDGDKREKEPHVSLRVVVEDARQAIPQLLDAIEASGAEVRSVGQFRPTFDEVFVRLIERQGARRPPLAALRAHGEPGPEDT